MVREGVQRRHAQGRDGAWKDAAKAPGGVRSRQKLRSSSSVPARVMGAMCSMVCSSRKMSHRAGRSSGGGGGGGAGGARPRCAGPRLFGAERPQGDRPDGGYPPGRAAAGGLLVPEDVPQGGQVVHGELLQDQALRLQMHRYHSRLSSRSSSPPDRGFSAPVGRKPSRQYLREGGGLAGWLLFSQVDAPGIYELGWVLRRDCWGKGLAGEGSGLSHEYGCIPPK